LVETLSGCEVQEFCVQETRLWTPRAHEEEARSRFLRTHRHLHCGTKGVEKGSGRRLDSPGTSLYKGLVQCTRSGRVRIDDCRIPARLCASHLQGNADLPGTWFKPHCAAIVRQAVPISVADQEIGLEKCTCGIPVHFSCHRDMFVLCALSVTTDTTHAGMLPF